MHVAIAELILFKQTTFRLYLIDITAKLKKLHLRRMGFSESDNIQATR